MAKSKYRLGDKVLITSELYPSNNWLMGVISRIHDVDGSYMYDVHFGITGIKDEKNVREEDLKAYE